MTTLSDTKKFEILQKSSGDFLTASYPDNWEDMSDEDQDQFLEDNAWEPLQDHPIKEVAGMIATAADRVIEALEEKNSDEIYFLVILEVLSGEYEKHATHLVNAESESAAIIQAFHDESHNNLDAKDTRVHDDIDFAYRVGSVVQVCPEDINTLKKYLT
tara:strand:+ start:2444 stop:2920 length:477 start_codon:yes stop_codon:yes gene_type:complete